MKLIEEKLWEAKHSGGHLTVCEMAKLLKVSSLEKEKKEKKLPKEPTNIKLNSSERVE